MGIQDLLSSLDVSDEEDWHIAGFVCSLFWLLGSCDLGFCFSYWFSIIALSSLPYGLLTLVLCSRGVILLGVQVLLGQGLLLVALIP